MQVERPELSVSSYAAVTMRNYSQLIQAGAACTSRRASAIVTIAALSATVATVAGLSLSCKVPDPRPDASAEAGDDAQSRIVADSSVGKSWATATATEWLEGEVWPEAQKRGIARDFFEATFKGFEPDRSLSDIPRPGGGAGSGSAEGSEGGMAPEDPQTQPEFDGPGRYFEPTEFGQIIEGGRRRLTKHRTTLAQIEARYGVPGAFLVAIWGRETSYGSVRPRQDAVRVMATRAWLGRRKERFGNELLGLLEVMASGEAPSPVRSSSMGAMGLPQFLPSAWIRYAVDFDGDGRRDIWESVPDALASIARYLQAHGWESGNDWGYEVEVPAGVPCTDEGPEGRRPLKAWRDLGLRRTAKREFPSAKDAQMVSLLMPAGRQGPAFLVTENFYALKSYNRADVYALYVGHLADRMRGAPAFTQTWRSVDRLTVDGVKTLQQRLVDQGLDVGGIDGLVGVRTRTAIGLAQQRAGLPPLCFPGTPIGGPLSREE